MQTQDIPYRVPVTIQIGDARDTDAAVHVVDPYGRWELHFRPATALYLARKLIRDLAREVTLDRMRGDHPDHLAQPDDRERLDAATRLLDQVQIEGTSLPEILAEIEADSVDPVSAPYIRMMPPRSAPRRHLNFLPCEGIG